MQVATVAQAQSQLATQLGEQRVWFATTLANLVTTLRLPPMPGSTSLPTTATEAGPRAAPDATAVVDSEAEGAAARQPSVPPRSERTHAVDHPTCVHLTITVLPATHHASRQPQHGRRNQYVPGDVCQLVLHSRSVARTRKARMRRERTRSHPPSATSGRGMRCIHVVAAMMKSFVSPSVS